MVWEGRERIEGSGGLQALGDTGTVVPSKATMTFEGAKGTPDAVMDFEIRDDRPECTSIVIKAKPNGRGIRSADVAMVAGKVDHYAVNVFYQVGTIGVPDEERHRRALRDVTEARYSRRGAVTREDLADVARIYREHTDSAPTKAVELMLGLSRRTAARRVQQAREAGLLPETSQGRKKA